MNTSPTPRPLPVAALLTSREFARVLDFDQSTFGCIIDGSFRNVETFNANVVELAATLGAPQGLLTEAIENRNKVTWFDDTDAAQNLTETADEAIEWLNDNDPYGTWELYESALYRHVDAKFSPETASPTPRPLPVATLLTSREFARVLDAVSRSASRSELANLSRTEYKSLIRDTAHALYPVKMSGQ